MNLFFKSIFPSITWRMKTDEKVIYLTFDDGPVPEVTSWVLEILKQYNARATFFCVGENAKNHPEIVEQILDGYHSIGNHTMHHLNGWKISKEEYNADILACNDYFNTKLFRPPYGKIKFSQIKEIRKNFRIIMWDVLSKDYDSSLDEKQCFERIKRKTDNGSIIVFHDSLKAEKRMRYGLKATLEYYSEKGFIFRSINPN